MKLLLTMLLIAPVFFVCAQDMQFKITVEDKSIVVSPENEEQKTIEINKEEESSSLKINVINEEIDASWKRKFILYDSADKEIQNFDLMKDGSYCLKMSDVSKYLKLQAEYFIYTIATPKDPKQSMQIKIARLLVCKIKIL